MIREFQDDLFDQIASVVYAHEGFVEKFIGDAVVALFGAPLTHEDDPERALRTALAMRERMEGINDRWVDRLGQTLELHIGVNSGPVVAGQIAADRGGAYSVTGDTVNTASRLQVAAKPGQILVSQSTQRLAREAFDFRRLKAIKVQGKRDPVTVFELQRARLFPGQGRGVQGLAAAMVGRSSEFAQLQHVTEQLTGRPRAGRDRHRRGRHWEVAADGRVASVPGQGHSLAGGALVLRQHRGAVRAVRRPEPRYAGDYR